MIPKGERPIEEVVGENVKHYFEESGLTLSALSLQAMKTGNLASLKKILAKEGNPTIRTLQRLAEVLGVKTIDLIEDWREEDE